MAPFILLLVSTALFWFMGRLGVTAFQSAGNILRIALGLMFLMTASAHWGKRRPDLIRMVPPFFSHPHLLVTITGLLEIVGAIGLFLPGTARMAAICLLLLLLAVFPANIYAARRHLTIAGAPVPGLLLRTAIQIVFVAALAGVICL